MERIILDDRNIRAKASMLRAKGFVPGIVYGPKIVTEPVKVPHNYLRKKLKAGENVFELKTPKGVRYVKFQEVQKDPVTKEPVHFSLVQLPVDQMSVFNFPIEYMGVPIGVKKGGVLVQVRQELKIETRPLHKKTSIKVPIADLDIGDKITVADLNLRKGIDLQHSPTEVLAICVPNTKVGTKISNDGVNPSHPSMAQAI